MRIPAHAGFGNLRQSLIVVLGFLLFFVIAAYKTANNVIAGDKTGLAFVALAFVGGAIVIASAVGGLREAIGQAGLTFPPGDAAALAAAIKIVVQQPDLVISLGQKARDRAQALFLRAPMIQSHRSVYCDAVRR